MGVYVGVPGKLPYYGPTARVGILEVKKKSLVFKHVEEIQQHEWQSTVLTKIETGHELVIQENTHGIFVYLGQD